MEKLLVEARYRKKDILTMCNLMQYLQNSINGRNFEYMEKTSVLSSKMVVPYIKGVQLMCSCFCKTLCTLNNQEQFRHTSNVIVEHRELYKIYLPAFKAASTRRRHLV